MSTGGSMFENNTAFTSSSAKSVDSKENAQSSNERSSTVEELDYNFSNEKGYNQGGEKPDGNILSQYSENQAMSMGRNFAHKYDLDQELFAKAAAIARSPTEFNSMPFLSEEEKIQLNNEYTKRWYIPKSLVLVISMGSMAAAVQGMDEAVINGANLFYPEPLGIGSESDRDKWLQGLVNSAPYLCCSCISCWLSDPLNKKLGRKKTIFITCFISAITCFWQGFANTWYHLFIARFMLGFGIGPKSATVPVYSAECAPAKIRGSLVMLWQFFTAFGIMFGYVSSLVFLKVPAHGIGNGGLNWRLMLGSAMLPAVIVCFQVLFCPESPRWLMGRDRYADAYQSLKILRKHELFAARDCFYQYVLLKEESSYSGSLSTLTRIKEMFTIRRNRNGAIGAWIVMFMQQFCGINVIAYYSSSIFIQSGFSKTAALLASWGFGMLDFVFALPAFYTIDSFGRRNLLLFTFPLMSLFLLLTGFAFWIPLDTDRRARIGVISLGIYLFTIVYSSGEGPVPFTYSAEAFPLYVRDLGMSFATATCWFFNFILSVTWPALLKRFKAQGAFGWYAAWNLVGFFLVLWFLPETKGLTLEELDDVFSVPILSHAKYQNSRFVNIIKRKVFRQHVDPIPPLHVARRQAVTHESWNEKAEASHVDNINT